jgi:hypothetical protein
MGFFLQRRLQIGKTQKNNKRRRGRKRGGIIVKKPVGLVLMSKEAWRVYFL